VDLLVLGRGEVAAGAVKAPVVVPVDPLEVDVDVAAPGPRAWIVSVLDSPISLLS
jgi:hypothetical protein